MGNALVVPLVTRMGRRLVSWIVREEPEGRKKRLLDGQIEVEAPVAKAKAKARKATASKR
jgi:hypothetical protein